MAKTYRMDVRFIPEPGINALRRVDSLIKSISDEAFTVSDSVAFDDGMRVSMLVNTENNGRHELKLLSLVSQTGSIGRFSCREADEETVAIAAATDEEMEAALV